MGGSTPISVHFNWENDGKLLHLGVGTLYVKKNTWNVYYFVRHDKQPNILDTQHFRTNPWLRYLDIFRFNLQYLPSIIYIYISWNIDTWNRKIITRDSKLWGFPRYGGTPIAGWFIMEIPMNMDDLGYPYFRTPPYRFIDVFFYEILEYRWVQYCDSIYQHGKLGVWLANIAYEPP